MATNISSALPSKTALAGHMRRAQARVTDAFGSDEPSDLLIQATVGAAATSVALRLLRNNIIGSVVSRWAPLFVFAAVYQYAQKSRRSR